MGYIDFQSHRLDAFLSQTHSLSLSPSLYFYHLLCIFFSHIVVYIVSAALLDRHIEYIYTYTRMSSSNM